MYHTSYMLIQHGFFPALALMQSCLLLVAVNILANIFFVWNADYSLAYYSANC